MPLVSRTIPNLVQGVSQQPEVLRLSSQATTQLNGFSSVVEGLKKRPPTNYIAKLSSSTCLRLDDTCAVTDGVVPLTIST